VTIGESSTGRPAPSNSPAECLPPRPGENAVVWTLWLTYGAFYFCRTNISAAVPGLKMATDAGGLGIPADQVGWILASLKIAYGLGQLINGQLSERFSPRVLLAAGMFGSAALNVAFGLGTSFYFLLFVWACNGFFQSLGWTPCVRVLANWIPILRRGNALGIVGTGYQITLGLTYVIAGQSAERWGWHAALYVPAVLLTLTGVFMLFFLRESPDGEQPDERSAPRRPMNGARVSLTESLYWTLYNPTLWLLGLALGLLNACRYGFLDWGVAHLMETQQVKVGKATLQFFVIAIGATAGSYLAGWATDRFFGSRRAPVICILTALLGVLTLSYDSVARQDMWGTMSLLVVIGFCIYGPQVLLVGTAPADLAHRGTSAAAAGFVNFIGYMGAAAGDVITGYLSDASHGGWQTAIYVWAGWAFTAAVIAGLLWNTTSRKVGVFPAIVPKVSLVVMGGVAAYAIASGDFPQELQWISYAGVAAAAGSFFSRWSAVPVLALGGAGVLGVFITYVQSSGSVTWNQSVAMIAFGLAVVLGLMILVEQKVEPCE
jgi:sugar phosphate permease